MSKPYKIVYGIRKTGQKKESGEEWYEWTPIGAAFVNQDGSLNVVLHYVPADLGATRIQIRAPRPKEDEEKAADESDKKYDYF